jgi:hypothetical protein
VSAIKPPPTDEDEDKSVAIGCTLMFALLVFGVFTLAFFFARVLR